MCNQRDAMRTWNVDRIWVGVERGFDNLQLSKHCRSKQVETRAVFEQVIGNFFMAHMCRGAEAGFKIPAAPVPGCVDQPWLLREQFLDAFKVAMRLGDKFLN